MGVESGVGNDVVDLTDSDDAWEKIEEATNAVTKELDDGVRRCGHSGRATEV